MKQIYSTACRSIKTDHVNKEETSKKSILLLLGLVSTLFVFADNNQKDTGIAPIPELVFMNPVLVSGQANSEGAIYRFKNVTTGIDAEIKLRKFSRKDIVMTNIDLPGLGWEKAFQPQFGLAGYVNPNQHWYIDFECIFYQGGKNSRQKMQRFDLTSLDVDGDGVTIAEYVQMERPKSVAYSTITSLITGVPNPEMECGRCGLTSTLITCTNCNGFGRAGISACGPCEGSGKVHNDCGHPWDGSTNQFVQGTVLNFANIDTAATQVMATYTYLDKDKINFRIGATSGTRGSNGAGIRLNSLWFRSFSLAPQSFLLPARLGSFSATHIGSQVNLKWFSAQENQFSHFIVEKSLDGQQFNEMGLVFSSDSRNDGKEYTTTDTNIGKTSGIVYYRLKMVDTDNHTSYSAIRVVRIAVEKENLSILTYPNPAINEIRVTIPEQWQNRLLTVSVYNQWGELVKQVTRISASQTETVNVSDLHTGIFIIKAATSTEQSTSRFVKMK
jgi:hypothetical protein